MAGIGSPGYKSFAQQQAEAKELKQKRLRIAVTLFLLIGGTVFAMGWNPPEGSVHSFTKLSDYNSEKETGCVNSGEGCHGDETQYTSFNSYHPNADCTDCHDYQGVGCIPCHTPSGTECTSCHDGTMKNAGDRTRITDPYPRGHYRETTHTAMGTDMDGKLLAAKGGTASATCRDCHSRDLLKAHKNVDAAKGSPYGTSVGCGECHNDERAKGLKQVKADWIKDRCEDCHDESSSAEIHDTKIATSVKAAGESACGSTGTGCHEGNNIHALHPDAPKTCSGSAKKGEPSCHDLEKQADKPDTVSCGGSADHVCHVAYVNDDYSHKNDKKVHAPETQGPASDSSFHETACGGCHAMDADGKSLVDEHALATSRSDSSKDVCSACHSAAASAEAIGNEWADRETPYACDACHGTKGLDAMHGEDIAGNHVASGSDGCANTGWGCHPTDDLSQVGAPTTTENIHRDCLRCHDRTASDGNIAYSPGSTSCGQARDCHAGMGDYSPATAVHAGGTRVDGADARHLATVQGKLVYSVSVGGVNLTETCDSCHAMKLGTEHARTNSSIATGANTVCQRCHSASSATGSVVKGSWSAKTSTKACAACHDGATVSSGHLGGDAAEASAHSAVELDMNGAPAPGSCSAAGCHDTKDVRTIHSAKGCAFSSCHQATGNILGKNLMSCGGKNAAVACHANVLTTQHAVSHAADTADKALGCFGCHRDDLASEHSTALASGSMEGGATSTCRICHFDANTGGNGTYSKSTAVKTAITAGTKKCTSCHKSGTAADGSVAVASPHKAISTDPVLPAGFVWADPFTEWKTAFEAPTGGGHNVLTASAVGASAGKQFPVTTFNFDVARIWPLPANEATTTWLDPVRYPTASVDTTAEIQMLKVTCGDCHAGTEAMAGPQGAAVPVKIDSAYSQTEYANPSAHTYQFDPYNLESVNNSDNPVGYKPVICVKCHSVTAHINPATGAIAYGGTRYHSTHASRHTIPWADRKEACIDCHTRIPHAWRRPRLLISTQTTGGVVPDQYPYVQPGQTGLIGLRLLATTDPTRIVGRDTCTTGGCYSQYYASQTPPRIRSESPTEHPTPSVIPTATYWP